MGFDPATIGAIITATAAVAQTISGVTSAASTADTAERIRRAEIAEAQADTERAREERKRKLRALSGEQAVRGAPGRSTLDLQLETIREGSRQLADIDITGQRTVRSADIRGRTRVQRARREGFGAIIKGAGQLGSLATKSFSAGGVFG